VPTDNILLSSTILATLDPARLRAGAETLLPPAVLATLDPARMRMVGDLGAAYAAEPAPTLSRAEAMGRTGWSLSTLIKRENSGAVDSFLDGASRRITTISLYRCLANAVVDSRGEDGAARKARQPAKRFRRQARPRTQAELDGLKKVNQIRRLEALKRREAKAPPATPRGAG
jgi:hypothetical protein